MASGEVSIRVTAKDGATRVLAGIESRLKSFSSGVRSIGASLIGGFGIGAAVSAVSGLVRRLDDIGDAAANLDVTTDVFQALQAVGRQTNNAFGDVQKTFEKVRKAQSDIGSDKRLQSLFEKLNIDAGAFRQLKTEDAMSVLGKAVSESTNQFDALNVVTEIFGDKIGPKLVAMLRSVAGDGFDPVIARAKATGQIVSRTAIDWASTWADAWEASKKGYETFFGQLASGAVMTFSKLEESTMDVEAAALSMVAAYEGGLMPAEKLLQILTRMGRIDLMPKLKEGLPQGDAGFTQQGRNSGAEHAIEAVAKAENDRRVKAMTAEARLVDLKVQQIDAERQIQQFGRDSEKGLQARLALADILNQTEAVGVELAGKQADAKTKVLDIEQRIAAMNEAREQNGLEALRDQLGMLNQQIAAR
jgi:hypothetical protein